MGRLKVFLKRLASYCGLEIRRRRLYQPRISMGEALQHLLGLGFYPRTIIDVGVANGTFDLYRTFPDAFVVLIEPLKEFEQNLISITSQYHGTYVIAAAASQEGQININVHLDHLNGSSIYKETMGVEADGASRQVETIQIDKFLEQKSLSGPYLIKIDVQGAELDVLNGCSKALGDAEAVILEVSMFQFMKSTPQFHDVVFYMKQHEFVAYDILPAWNRPLDNALGQLDMVFVKEFSRFRTSHAYSTFEQRRKLFKA